jgi:hypothetical protein
MNSSMSEATWLSPVAAHEVSLHPADPQVIFDVAVAQAILAAAITGVFTATVAIGSTPSVVVQYVVAHLNQGNYQAQVTGTNLVINW